MQPETETLLYACISSFCLAGSLMEHFAVFSGWTSVDPKDLAALQAIQGHGALCIYVMPKAVLTIYILTQVLGSSAISSRISLSFSLAMMAISWTISFAILIPLELRIRQLKERSDVRKLITFNRVRVLAMAAHCSVVIWSAAAHAPLGS